jgi:hypothetical protein
VSRAPTFFQGADVVPLSGGYSGETFLVTTGGEQAVLRLYARQPRRAAVDRALLERLRGLLPVPAVLESSLLPGGPDQPPFLLLEALPGDRLDVVLPAADTSLRRRLGEAVAGVLVLLATERMPRPGWFADASLDWTRSRSRRRRPTRCAGSDPRPASPGTPTSPRPTAAACGPSRRGRAGSPDGRGAPRSCMPTSTRRTCWSTRPPGA